MDWSIFLGWEFLLTCLSIFVASFAGGALFQYWMEKQ